MWRKIAVSSAFVLVFLGILVVAQPGGVVSAQGGATLTPTPNYCPATPTPTSIIPTPAGLETVVIPTADFGTQMPTSVFATLSVQTPVPTGTATGTPPPVTPSPTVPAGASIFMWGGCNTGEGVTCEQITPTYWHFTKSGSDIYVRQNTGFSSTAGGTVYMLFHLPGTSYTITNASPATSPFFTHGAGFSISRVPFSWFNDGYLTGGNPAGYTGQYAGDAFEKWVEATGTITGGTTNREIGVLTNIAFNGVEHYSVAGIEWWVSFQPLYAPTAIPPTATPGADCIINTSTNVTSDVIEWEEPVVVLGECYTIIPEVMIPLPELSWSPFTLPDEVGIPGLFVCIDTLTATLKFLSFDVIALMSGIVIVICGVIIYRQINS